MEKWKWTSGGVRKGLQGRGASGKVPVFGCLERKGKVYTQMIQRKDIDADYTL